MGKRQGPLEDLVMPSQAFWRGKRVLVTGHTGFKGSWLCLWLGELGATVTGYALQPPTQPSMFEAARVATGLRESVIADIRDRQRLEQVLTEGKPEIVFHMAAQPLVRASYVDPVETYSVNVLGTVTLLDAIRHSGDARVVVNVTSDKCYENREWVWGYRESDSMGGYDPYSNSKGCAELVTAAFRSSFFNPAHFADHGVAIASARAGNVLGGGDWAEDRLIPDMVRAFAANKPVLIRRPDAIRPWQHVLEPLSGYLALAERLYSDGAAFAEGWNFGPNDDDTLPVSRLAERLTALWGGGASWRLDGEHHPHEATYLKLDCSKARSRLGWQPRWRLERAIETTAQWYRAYYAREDARALALTQIAQYAADRSTPHA